MALPATSSPTDTDATAEPTEKNNNNNNNNNKMCYLHIRLMHFGNDDLNQSKNTHLSSGQHSKERTRFKVTGKEIIMDKVKVKVWGLVNQTLQFSLLVFSLTNIYHLQAAHPSIAAWC